MRWKCIEEQLAELKSEIFDHEYKDREYFRPDNASNIGMIDDPILTLFEWGILTGRYDTCRILFESLSINLGIGIPVAIGSLVILKYGLDNSPPNNKQIQDAIVTEMEYYLNLAIKMINYSNNLNPSATKKILMKKNPQMGEMSVFHLVLDNHLYKIIHTDAFQEIFDLAWYDDLSINTDFSDFSSLQSTCKSLFIG